MDWMDKIYMERLIGENKPLFQYQHNAVNKKYQGCTEEVCCQCGSATGKSGLGDGSLYRDNGDGPFCDKCFELEK